MTQGLLQHLFGPGMRAMRWMRMPAKLGLMLLVVALPLVYVSGSVLLRLAADIDYTRSELEGVKLIQPISDVLEQVYQSRQQEVLLHVSAGWSSSTDTRGVQQRQAALEAVDFGVRELRHFDLQAPWEDARRQLSLMQTGMPEVVADTPVNAIRAKYEVAMAPLWELPALIGERSGLLLDPEAAPYMLMDLALERVPVLQGRMAELTLELMLALNQTHSGPAQVERQLALQARVQQVRQAMVDTQRKMDMLVRAGGTLPTTWSEARAGLTRFLRGVNDHVAAPDLTARADMFGEQTHDLTRQLRQVHHQVNAELQQHLAQRLQHFHAQRWFQFGLIALCILGVGYWGGSFYWSLVTAMSDAQWAVKSVAAGDFSTLVPVRGQDEWTSLSRDLDAMVRQLSILVANIRSSAGSVGHSGQVMSSDAIALAAHTDEQAEGLRTVVGTLEGLGQAVMSNATDATRLGHIADSLRDRAREGDVAMGETVESIMSLEERMVRVAEINGVIDDIAFQTNLLALNAAVEAARAGDSGKGFSVVAAEVRQLARRCAEAAAEIKALIETANSQVADASSRIQDVSITLQHVVGGVDEVSSRLQSIASASAQQATGLTEVNTTVSRLMAQTQSNAQAVDRTSQAGQNLADNAASLSESVATIRLRAHGDEDVSAMVRRALAHVAHVGWKQACEALHLPHNKMVPTGMMLLAVDEDNGCLICTEQPSAVGHALLSQPGWDSPAVAQVLQSARQVLAQGGHWVALDAPPSCRAYVEDLGDGSLMLCAQTAHWAALGESGVTAGIEPVVA